MVLIVTADNARSLMTNGRERVEKQLSLFFMPRRILTLTTTTTQTTSTHRSWVAMQFLRSEHFLPPVLSYCALTFTYASAGTIPLRRRCCVTSNRNTRVATRTLFTWYGPWLHTRAGTSSLSKLHKQGRP